MRIIKGFPILVFALALAGCSFTVNVPTLQTVATEVMNVNEAYPSGNAVPLLQITMGAGTLNLAGGADALVSGEIHYNVTDWKPVITQVNDGIRLSQKETETIGFPSGNIVNEWTLKLGKKPLGLNIFAGAYTGTLDLTGVPLTSLEVSDGASKSTVLFDSPNPVEMKNLVYKTGASQVSITGIANANVSQVTFEGGAGAYTFDFSGELKKNLLCTIKSGVSDVKLILPQGTHAKISVTGGISNVNASGTWNITGSTYETGSGSPLIEIQVEMPVGNLSLSQK